MKNILFRFLLGAVAFMLFYLLGAFISASFNLITWSFDLRIGVAWFGGIAVVIIMTFPNHDF